MSSFRGITFCLQDDVVSVRSCFGSGEWSWEQNLLRSRDLTLTVNYASDLGGNCAVTFLAILFLLQRACAIYFRKANIGRRVGGGEFKVAQIIDLN